MNIKPFPCRFCGAGDTRIEENTYWSGTENVVLSATIDHLCEPPANNGSYVSITIRAPTREDAVKIWNAGQAK